MTFIMRGSVTRCGAPLLVHVPHASRVIPPDIRAEILLRDSELEVGPDQVQDAIGNLTMSINGE